MPINSSVVDELPVKARTSARDSQCHAIVMLARESHPRYVRITADTTYDITKFYKTLIQFKKRHEVDLPFHMRKLGDEVFIWFDKEDAEAA